MKSTLDSRITSPFDAQSTAVDVSQGISLAGMRAIVTGAASGIGIETARALTAIGADVTLAVRDTHAGARGAVGIPPHPRPPAPRAPAPGPPAPASIPRPPATRGVPPPPLFPTPPPTPPPHLPPPPP